MRSVVLRVRCVYAALSLVRRNWSKSLLALSLGVSWWDRGFRGLYVMLWELRAGSRSYSIFMALCLLALFFLKATFVSHT